MKVFWLAFVLVVMAGQLHGQEKALPGAFERYTERLPGKGGTVSFEMVPIPAGTLKMKVGEEEREVELKRFWMGKTEVTWDELDVWVHGLDVSEDPVEREKKLGPLVAAKTHPSKPYGQYDHGFGRAGYPAIGVHHNAAMWYCRRLSEKTGKKYRLPTEAEWEWACRGGAKAEPSREEVMRIAWVKENATPEGAEDPQTWPVGKKPANGYGLHDMLGNVAEWVMVGEGQTPVVKGGSWRMAAERVSVGMREPFNEKVWQRSDPEDPKSVWWLRDGPFVGFRLVREE